MQAYKVDMQVSILNIFENRAFSSSCREKKYCDVMEKFGHQIQF